MRWKDIIWKSHGSLPNRLHAQIVVGVYRLSVITESEADLYECAIMSDVHGDFITLPGIMEEEDDVLRYQTQEEVVGLIRKLETIDGTPPKNHH